MQLCGGVARTHIHITAFALYMHSHKKFDFGAFLLYSPYWSLPWLLLELGEHVKGRVNCCLIHANTILYTLYIYTKYTYRHKNQKQETVRYCYEYFVHSTFAKNWFSRVEMWLSMKASNENKTCNKFNSCLLFTFFMRFYRMRPFLLIAYK